MLLPDSSNARRPSFLATFDNSIIVFMVSPGSNAGSLKMSFILLSPSTAAGDDADSPAETEPLVEDGAGAAEPEAGTEPEPVEKAETEVVKDEKTEEEIEHGGNTD